MRIICLTSRLPYPPHRGDRLRAFHFMEHLSREHDLHLLSFIAEESERQHVPALREYCADVNTVLLKRTESLVTVAANIWRRQPLQALYYRSTRMQTLVEESLAAQRFHAAYVHLFRMAPYVANHPKLYRIVDLTDVISKEIGRSLAYRGAMSRLVYRLERPRIRRYERRVTDAFEETWLISEADRKALAADCPGANIQVVTNGVDTDHFHPKSDPPAPDSLVFVGHMGVRHNIDAAAYLVHDILPLVRRQVPSAALRIVGAAPAPEVQHLDKHPGVEVTGFAPDLNAALNRAAVFVAPLRFAAGVQNKVLEAMAAARPVVTTTIVNEGLRARPGRDLLVADDPQDIARHVVALLRDAGLRRSIGRSARRFVRDKYTWQQAVDRMRVIEQNIT